MNEYKKALKIVQEEIIKDPDLYRSYKSNIAMEFYDHIWPMIVDGQCLDTYLLHKKSNKSADYFMKLWLGLPLVDGEGE